MQYEFDKHSLAVKLKTKRIIEMNVGLREIVKKSKIPISTLSRAEREKPIDMRTFLLCCAWLEEEPTAFFKLKSKKKP